MIKQQQKSQIYVGKNIENIIKQRCQSNSMMANLLNLFFIIVLSTSQKEWQNY
ncbi:unnamed protein product [Paramecium octaurelia]|uniref:Uncharacterized protein n=1 Tax=Paramecium octaurelia TaxID=43137 RepID=A0A8S1VNZ9_PAROT|nr:unnamed protein product [Paramecium octaurelia]